MGGILNRAILVLFAASISGCNIKLFNLSEVAIHNRRHNQSCGITLDLSNKHFPEIGPNFLSNLYINKLLLRNSSVQVVREGAFDGLPNLFHLDLSHNRLSANGLFSFGSHGNLSTLILDNNNWQHEPNVTLKIDNDLPRLSTLSIRNISLKQIPSELSRRAPSLTSLDVSLNYLDSDSFGLNLPSSVTHLTWVSNRGAIHTNRLNATRHLESLVLDHNYFYEVSDPSTSGCKTNSSSLCLDLPHLRELSIEGCNVQRITPDAFRSLGRLRRLNLRNNSLVEIHNNVLESASNLTSLDLSENPLRRVPNFNLLSNLTSLTLRDMGNSATVRELLETAWDFGQLRDLSLSGNEIRSIPSTTLQTMDSLEGLDLSRNKIDSIHFHWGLMPNLRRLNLSDNSITDLKNVFLNGSEDYLTLLDITKNSLSNIRIKDVAYLPIRLNILLGPICW